MSGTMAFLVDAAPDAEWEVWYEDTFDRETPRRVETSGRGLAAGLAELWERHLCETVQSTGGKGFARFNLWWRQRSRSIEVIGDWDGMVRLRSWVFEAERRADRGLLLGAGARDLLGVLGAVHSCLAIADRSSEDLLMVAVAAESRQDFASRLSRLADEALGNLDGRSGAPDG